jgi:RNA polymerase sigma factor (sigma-70 family)
MSRDTSFLQLMERVRQGDQAAATELHRTYSEPVQRLIRVRMTSDGLRRQLDSSDVCQSVFADFFVRMALGQYDFSEPAQLVKLLTTMARNRVIYHAERHQAAIRDVRRVEPAAVENFDIPASKETPSQIASTRELVERFESRLTDDERSLVGHRRAGKTWDEIGAELKRTPDAVRKQYERAIDRVSRELGLSEIADG